MHSEISARDLQVFSRLQSRGTQFFSNRPNVVVNSEKLNIVVPGDTVYQRVDFTLSEVHAMDTERFQG